MLFKTVFDATQQGYTAGAFLIPGVIISAVGALMVSRPALMQRLLPRGLQGTARVIFSWVYFVLGLVWTTTVLATTYNQHQAAVADLTAGHYAVVEGPVTHFVPMPYEGHALEKFTVKDRRFSYSDNIITPGFRNTASHGGPIREGLYVRVSYSGNLILRLEVAQ